MNANGGGVWPIPRSSGQENQDSLIKRKDEVAAVARRHNLTAAVKWPTPRACEAEGGVVRNVQCKDGSFFRENKKGVRFGVKLKDAVNKWPTPRASEWKGVGPLDSKSQAFRLDKGYLDATVQDAEQKTGALNPDWVEWLMGYPENWTNIDKNKGIHYDIAVEPEIPRLTDEKKNRANRLKALGNAVVPHCVKIIGEMIKNG